MTQAVKQPAGVEYWSFYSQGDRTGQEGYTVSLGTDQYVDLATGTAPPIGCIAEVNQYDAASNESRVRVRLAVAARAGVSNAALLNVGVSVKSVNGRIQTAGLGEMATGILLTGAAGVGETVYYIPHIHDAR